LARAKQVAGAKDIRIGGGASVVRQYLQARLIDELRLAVAPVFIGAGENLFAGLNLPDLGYAAVESVAGANATHVTVRRRSP
jgi:dihydrofolate reductase